MRVPKKYWVDSAKLRYPPGTRLELTQMGEDPRPVPPGTRGTVVCVDDIGQIQMQWDNGRTLALIPGEDAFRKLSQEEIAQEQQKESLDLQTSQDQDIQMSGL